MIVTLGKFGPCARRRVRCTIFTGDGAEVVGENSCMNAQDSCPRLPGEGYEKCATICQQVGHAEQVAVSLARAADLDLSGAFAIVKGHTYACQACQEALYGAGVRWVRVDAAPVTTTPQEGA